MTHTTTTHNVSNVPERLAGHLLVEALVAQGIDTAFGVPGESFLAVLDGFRAIAILAVLLHHYLPRWAPPDHPQNLYGYTSTYSSPAGRRAERPSWPRRKASSPGGPASVS